MTSIEQKPQATHPYLPPEAHIMLEPSADLHLKLSNFDNMNPADRNAYVLTSNIFQLGQDLRGLGYIQRDTVEGSFATLYADDKSRSKLTSNLRVTDEFGTSMIKFDEGGMSVALEEPGTKAEKEIPLALVPETHWIAMASAKEGLEEGERRGGRPKENGHKIRRQQRSSRFLGSLIGGKSRIGYIS